MSATAEAFIADLLSNPDDTATRLIFADWIEEQGEEKYAADLRHPIVGLYAVKLLVWVNGEGKTATYREFLSAIDSSRCLAMCGREGYERAEIDTFEEFFLNHPITIDTLLDGYVLFGDGSRGPQGVIDVPKKKRKHGVITMPKKRAGRIK